MALKTIRPRIATIDTRRVKPAPKTGDPLYHSSPWRTLLKRIMAQRGRRCEACGATGGVIYGDHVREVRDGGAELDARNVRLLCAPCHGKKTSAARARRAAERFD
ncbi:HNH endonuclease signature motif containing protein [Hansschlegelia plantiphila]|uniref:HNH nuclease domain-containing protein n=1 Tax=Hansschlegelia plantiphila TaxID=374655 RepID=A0A9W6MWU5_9HYPH|nr:HNH endonuclease signature motif containing protein [Hansschlegelia plantiphila]GLK69192.1 hypothetical protein GCM10008179_28300 [Hansschlegelia plantiphila]